ncbi:Hypothetical protein ORPV_569 [Orpheovirus IHUMI-LCC2]|uniref:Uncharacterized protein n=1 Tax=Orpheovirus IHUMI-LCC2 TaxID=2023057 RepID=A0A2I2L4L7_9VIRU|nr:Hypothetical protein ORPV_569 [Orpheovirus IHUMI-LCC2]SNW62473.1 Hypothetical protein ORPV_569 [Orpheovirus IHUMI-LCC2]
MIYKFIKCCKQHKKLSYLYKMEVERCRFKYCIYKLLGYNVKSGTIDNLEDYGPKIMYMNKKLNRLGLYHLKKYHNILSKSNKNDINNIQNKMEKMSVWEIQTFLSSQ